MSYLLEDNKVGVKDFLIFTVVILDKILVSTESIKPVNLECL